MATKKYSTKEKGNSAEERAVEYLTLQGFQVLDRNFYSRRGEIDIIGYDGDYLVFVEVKYRTTNHMGEASEAVDYKKQQRICATANYYRYIKRIQENVSIRYDVVSVQGDTINWIKNAFSHIILSGNYL